MKRNLNAASLSTFMAIYADHLRDVVSDPTNGYWYGVDAVPQVVGKMYIALRENTYNHDGLAFKRTCKSLGIKYTRKAIEEFLQEGAS